jgi:creatinine amidohydrolase
VFDSPAEVLIERMSWVDVESAIAAGKRTVIICAASTEQHGPHLPEATDALLGEAEAVGLARELGDALVAPVIRPGCSDHHMGFAGSLTISAGLLMDLLDAYVDSLRRHGFENFVVFSSHGGNFPVLSEWKRIRPAPGVIVLDDGAAYIAAMFEAIRAFGREDTWGPHAEVIETSAMLAVHPELVDMTRAVRGFTGELTLEQLLEQGMRAFTDTGIIGDATGARPEMGRAVVDAAARQLAAEVRRSLGP